jgi:hypothetical protein
MTTAHSYERAVFVANISRLVLLKLRALDEAARAADGITEPLASRGLLGVPGRADADPIARYLHNTMGVTNVVCGPVHIAVWAYDQEPVYVPTPTWVVQFCEHFDMGLYPSLVEGEPNEETAIAGRLPANEGPVPTAD